MPNDFVDSGRHPIVAKAILDQAEEWKAAYVAALVAAAPPLSAEARDRIALLFRGAVKRDERRSAA